MWNSTPTFNTSYNNQYHQSEFDTLLQSYNRLYDNSSPDCVFKWPVFIESSNVA